MFEIIPARTENAQTVYDWYKRKSKINFNPPYQRVSGLWDVEGKQSLIDSLINKFDIPKFYLHRIYDLDSNYLYSIIDGKQRLQTIFDFIDNKFSLAKEFNYYANEDVKLNGKSYDDIAEEYPKIIQDFDQYVLDIVQIVTDDEDIIRELFLRLNEGVNLNNSEKRLSQRSYLNEKIKESVKENEFFKLIQFKNRRYEHEELLTKILLLEEKDDFISLNKSNLDRFVKDNIESSEEIDATIANSEEVLHSMSIVFDNRENLLSQKSIIPIYYMLTKNNNNQDLEGMGEFIQEFDELRLDNRKLDITNSNPILIEFDRLNQQGANSKNSLVKRYKIIERFYKSYPDLTNISSEDLFQEFEEEL